MAYIKSFHSAAHSLVQAAVSQQFHASADAGGIAALHDVMQRVTAQLQTFPRRRPGAPRTRVSSNPLGATTPFSPACLALVYDYAVAAIGGDDAQMKQIASEYVMSGCDGVGWLGAALAYIGAHAEFWKKITYVGAPVPPDDTFALPLPEQESFRIGILGDWGTGESVAQLVVDAMMRIEPRIDLIVHVGDVYYAGTEDEVRRNYTDLIENARRSTGHRPPVYNLPGNHCYYTKGQYFYDALKAINAGAAFPGTPGEPAPTQGASFFVLRNSWLQLQGMDTGYYDSDLFAVADDTTRLHADEAAWHLHHLDDAASAGRSAILFSHHQPWSAFLGIGTGTGTAGDAEAIASMQMASYNVNLQAQLAGVPKGTVLAWFWGHEHVLEVYDQAAIAASAVPASPSGTGSTKPLSDLFPWMPYGACIGFSAFPMLDTDQPYNHVAPLIRYNEAYTVGTATSHGATVYNHGFTVLDVSKGASGPPTAVATYYQLPGDGSSPRAEPFPPSTVSSGGPAAIA